jgi:hypothetical protein
MAGIHVFHLDALATIWAGIVLPRLDGKAVEKDGKQYNCDEYRAVDEQDDHDGFLSENAPSVLAMRYHRVARIIQPGGVG